MDKKTHIFLVGSFSLTIVLLILVSFIYYKNTAKKNTPQLVKSFEECVALGYPIMKTYPVKCITPEGITFVDTSGTIPKEQTPATNTPSSFIKDDLIEVSAISFKEALVSPFILKGKARGPWYFEASFPVKLLDATGKQLFIGPAHTEGNWMTEDYTPFSITITFTKPSTATGTLILMKDNPSGDPIRDNSLTIPVFFK